MLAAAWLLVAFIPSAETCAEDWQMGETVLPADKAPKESPKRRGPVHPWFEITSVRKVRAQVNTNLEIEFKQKVGETPDFELVIISNGKRTRGIVNNSLKTNKIILNLSFMPNVGDDAEVWFEASGGYKICRSATIGSVANLTFARDWLPEDRETYEREQKVIAPPPPPQAGFVMVSETTTPLLPGMFVDATWMGEWHPAELVSVSRSMVTVKWEKTLAGRSACSIITRNRISIATATLDEGRKSPQDFKPSVTVLEGGTLPLTDEMIPLTSDITLFPGTPLMTETLGKWAPVTVSEIGDKLITVAYDGIRNSFSCQRSRLAIEKSVVKRLAEPDAKSYYAARLATKNILPGGNSNVIGSRRVMDYTLSLPMPTNSVKLPEDLRVTKGTKLSAVWGGKWYVLSVLSDSDEGPVECHWDNYPGNWNEYISRKSLAISKTDKARLEKAAGDRPDGNSVAKKPMDSDSKPKAKPAENIEFELVLVSVDFTKIKVAKVVMELLKVELKEALEMVNEAPITLKGSMSESDAKAWLRKLEAAGAKAKIQREKDE